MSGRISSSSSLPFWVRRRSKKKLTTTKGPRLPPARRRRPAGRRTRWREGCLHARTFAEYGHKREGGGRGGDRRRRRGLLFMRPLRIRNLWDAPLGPRRRSRQWRPRQETRQTKADPTCAGVFMRARWSGDPLSEGGDERRCVREPSLEGKSCRRRDALARRALLALPGFSSSPSTDAVFGARAAGRKSHYAVSSGVEPRAHRARETPGEKITALALREFFSPLARIASAIGIGGRTPRTSSTFTRRRAPFSGPRIIVMCSP